MTHDPLIVPVSLAQGPLNLDTRTGWPDDGWAAELQALRAKYPREEWREHANLGEMARFWLSRHDMFRELGGTLEETTAQFRNQLLTPQQFQMRFTRRLQFFLEQLEGHHHIEDAAYFPKFRAHEERLGRGFDVLEGDHDIIHRDIEASVDGANAMLQAIGASEGATTDALRFAADAYADTSARLLRRLTSHLRDEEDLIVPLILDRGEGRYS